MEYVGLDNNLISLRGLNHILKNNWSDKVSYRLFSVKSDNDEIYLKIEDHIPKMKRIYQAKENIMKEIDRLESFHKCNLYNSLKLLLNIPEEDENEEIRLKEESDKIKKQLISESLNNPISLSTVLL